MSRKPVTPNDDEKPAGTNQEPADIPVGRRYSGNEQILQIERELLAEGRELENRAIPKMYHPEQKDYSDQQEVRELIELESEKDHPNKQLIGLLNEQL